MPLMLHRIAYNLDVLKNDGCQLVEPKPLFQALLIASHGDPCGTGCCYFKDGTCPAYLKHHTKPEEESFQRKEDYVKSHSDQSGLIGGKWAGMSSKQIRKADGDISPSEFQNRKQAGNYKE